MAPFFSFIFCFLLLGCLRFSALANENGNNVSSRNLRKDPGYGRPIIAMANSPRCTFNGKPIDDGKSVSSPEPCLNCTCSKGILLCYLRTCNSVFPIQGCKVVKKPGTCCPQLECGDDSSGQSNDLKTDLHNLKYHLRQDDGSFFGLLPMDPRTDRSAISDSTTRKPFPFNWNMKENGGFYSVKGLRRSDGDSQLHYEQEEDYGEDELDRNNSAGYCISRGYKYTEGMAMLSPTKCEYCYCIGGQQMCVRPKCHLNIEGCVPRYQSGYTCCPSHYNCEIASGISELGNDDENYQLLSGNHTQYKTKATSCTIDGYDFDVGVAVPSSGHCQTCYCTKKGIICKRLECSPNVPGCIPVIPEGHCCPTQYKCDQKIINSTHIPVAHSTDNYDVTVISPSDVEDGTSSQASRTENPDIYSNSDQESFTTETGDSETVTGTSKEKQKITVELSEESDLESISVIPEENIAVLILTTEREGFENSPDDSSETETISDSNSPEEESSSSETISTSNAKRKSKPTKSNIKIQNRNYTRLSTVGSFTKPISGTSKNQDTTQEDSDTSEKDSYAYEYVEYLDDESPNNLQTFDPFSEYSLQPHDETIFTEEDRESSTATQLRNKVKEKRPPINGIFNQPNDESDDNAFREEHPDYRNAKTSTKSGETVYSTISRIDNEENLSNSPSRYTIYGTDRTRPATIDYSEYLTTRRNSIQKQKHRRPGIVTKYQTTYLRPQSTRPLDLSTGSIINSEDVRTAQTIPYDPTADRNTYTAESYTQTYGPHIRPNFTNKKNISNRRRRPEKLPQTTNSRQSTRPIPQDIADFLWSVTQLQNTQTAPTIGQGTTTRNINIGQGYVSETLPPIVLAAPKLILEESTSKSTHETTQTESTNVPTNPDSPSFNFQPEIIFSNHGPSHNRKPPKRDPEIPLIINNHKKTSTRLRPPVRFRPSSTQPSLDDTFVEISNHRPTNSHRRPPSKFPPYPHPAHRPGQGYNRDPHFRDSHPKLHRFNSDAHPQWSEDYEEYFYDTDHDPSTTTKTHEYKHNTISDTDASETSPTAIDTKITNPLTEEDSLTTAAMSITNSESFQEDFTTQTKREHFSTNTTEPNLVNNIANEIIKSFPENKTEQGLTETTKEKLTTTPFPRSTYYLPTLTTTTSVPYDTTKSFSGYVRNKHRGTSKVNSDGKFFRAEDDSKRWETGPSDHRLIEYNKKPADSFNSYLQTTSVKPPELTELPTPPPKLDDSREITDVCFVDGRYYTSGETIIKSNPCEMCSCFYGHPLCQVQQCPPPPDPSCALDYLPGYCCPRVTCGLETDPEQPPGIVSVSAPEPTSQEIRPPPIELDNQWKPLPHGPITRTTESNFKVESSSYENKVTENISSEDLVTPEAKTAPNDTASASVVESKFEPSDALITSHNFLTTQRSTTTTNFVTTTPRPSTTLASTEPPAEETSTTAHITETSSGTTLQFTTTTIMPTEYLTTTTTATTLPATTLKAFNEPVIDTSDSNEGKGAQNKSLIHDNSSGVRKVLDEMVTLPPSKVALSESLSGSEVDTVLPVIGTLAPTTISADEIFEIQSVTLGGADVVGVSTELGVNLKVSGCNVYGKYYKINDKVTALGKHCSECICTADGISCNTIC